MKQSHVSEVGEDIKKLIDSANDYFQKKEYTNAYNAYKELRDSKGYVSADYLLNRVTDKLLEQIDYLIKLAFAKLDHSYLDIAKNYAQLINNQEKLVSVETASKKLLWERDHKPNFIERIKYFQTLKLSDESNLLKIKEEIQACIDVYKKNNLYPGAEEQAYHDTLISVREKIDATVAAGERKEYDYAQAVKNKSLSAEKAIKDCISAAKKSIESSDLSSALISLRWAAEESKNIYNSADINNPDYADQKYFNSFIMILNKELELYEARKNVNVHLHVKDILMWARGLKAVENTEEYILPRHELRIVQAITDALEANWIKFDRRNDLEMHSLFAELATMISDDLEVAGCVTWFSNCGFDGYYLIHSKTISLDLQNKIRVFADNLQPKAFNNLLSLPIFANAEPTTPKATARKSSSSLAPRLL